MPILKEILLSFLQWLGKLGTTVEMSSWPGNDPRKVSIQRSNKKAWQGKRKQDCGLCIPSARHDQLLLFLALFFTQVTIPWIDWELPSNNSLVQLLIILVIISAFVEKAMCQEMIIWQITAGTLHNSFADTISIEPLLEKKNKKTKQQNTYEATSKLFMKHPVNERRLTFACSHLHKYRLGSFSYAGATVAHGSS